MILSKLVLLSFIIIITAISALNCVLLVYLFDHNINALPTTLSPQGIVIHPLAIEAPRGPTTNNPNLRVDVLFRGINFPTSMAFLGPNDILVLEKNNGTVKRIVNGVMLPEPLLHVPVATKAERGMLGMDVAKHMQGRNITTYVFLYYTESGGGKTGDDITSGVQPAGNRLYRYELVNGKLANPKLLLTIPAYPGSAHNGGKVVIGPDRNIYVGIGDVNDHNYSNGTTQAQNIRETPPPDGRGGILRVTQDGKAIYGIIGNKFPLDLYYAYGIRNTFGMDFDPITKNLWDTENGPFYGDEINLVKPGFNSGWRKVQGIWAPTNNHNFAANITLHPENNLVNFGGKGIYRPPEFVSYMPTIGLTALRFMHSDKLGKQYENDMLVGDFHLGNIYDFDLTKHRTSISSDGPLGSKIANGTKELEGMIFGRGFGGITDLEVGPDGYLYVLSLYKGGDNCDPKFPRPCINYSSSMSGTIFRVLPS